MRALTASSTSGSENVSTDERSSLGQSNGDGGLLLETEQFPNNESTCKNKIPII
jgi:hypothetical protein